MRELAYYIAPHYGKINALPRNYRRIEDGIVCVRMRDVCVIQFTFRAELISPFRSLPSFFILSAPLLTLLKVFMVIAAA